VTADVGDSYPSGVGIMSNRRILERGTIVENLLKEFHGQVGDGGECPGVPH
jgi:hypothetical protein